MRKLWHTTCSALRQSLEPSWLEVEDYRQPLAVLLAARYPSLDASSQEDVIQDILLELKESLFESYDRSAGRFRQFLSGVVRNRVLAHLKRRRREHVLGADPDVAFNAEDADQLRVLGPVFSALRIWLEGTRRDGIEGLQRLTVLSARLVGGESLRAIADRQSLPYKRVKRWMREARLAIVRQLLERSLRVPEDLREGLDFGRLAEAALRAFGSGRGLDAVGHPALRRALRDWLAELEAAIVAIPRVDLRGTELAEGLEILLHAAADEE